MKTDNGNEPSELEQLIWRIVVDVFNSKSDSPTEIYSKILKEEKDVVEQIKKLQAFKEYVHKRLDDAGIEKDPESPHKAAGCRIGGRLDIVLGYNSQKKES